MEILDKVSSYKDEMIEKLSEFCAIESTLSPSCDPKYPFGKGCYDALQYILDLASSMGFKTKNIDNVCGHIEYGEGDEIIGILCHCDVVPATGVWTSDPYKARVENGKLYARGSIDDKGPCISSLYALKYLKDNNIKLSKKVRLIVGTDEESGSRCLKRYLEVEKTPDISVSPDACFPLIYGEKGIMSMDIISENEGNIVAKSGDRYNMVPDFATLKFDSKLNEFDSFIKNNNYQGQINNGVMEFEGKTAHAMVPHLGVNAASHLCEFIKEESNLCKFACDVLSDPLLKGANLDFSDYEMGDLTCNFAVLDIENGKGKIGLNYRYPIRWDKDGFISKLEDIASKYSLTIKVLSDSPCHYLDPNCELVQTLLKSYQKYTNDYETKPLTIGGGTYARGLKNACAFGQVFPHEQDLAHQADEYIDLDLMIKATAIYVDSIINLGK